jgi:pimeloyl-ACP methyl ester carboxylesterase
MRPAASGLPVGVTERYETFAGFRTRVHEVAGGGPPFLLFHGYSDSADTWRLVLERLAAKGRRAAAVDLPSHGCADALDPELPVLAQLVEFADAAARAVGDRPIVVGNSLGGLVSLRLAGACDAIGGVVPVGPAGFSHPFWLWWAGRRPMLPVVELMATRPALAPLFRTVHRGGVHISFARPLRAERQAVRTYLSHLATPESRRQKYDVVRGLLDGGELGQPCDLAAIRCPAMLVWDDRDRLALSKGALTLIEAMPELRNERLRGVGHLVQLEVPDRLVELLEDFAPAKQQRRTARRPVA